MIDVQLSLHGSTYRFSYRTIEEAMEDDTLRMVLDQEGGTCELWCGPLRVTAKPIDSSNALREFLVSNSKTFLHRFRP